MPAVIVDEYQAQEKCPGEEDVEEDRKNAEKEDKHDSLPVCERQNGHFSRRYRFSGDFKIFGNRGGGVEEDFPIKLERFVFDEVTNSTASNSCAPKYTSAQIWDGGLILGEFLAEYATKLNIQQSIDLGSGTGVSSIFFQAARKLRGNNGSDDSKKPSPAVLCTDMGKLVYLMRTNIKANGLQDDIHVLGYDWDDPEGFFAEMARLGLLPPGAGEECSKIKEEQPKFSPNTIFGADVTWNSLLVRKFFKAVRACVEKFSPAVENIVVANSVRAGIDCEALMRREILKEEVCSEEMVDEDGDDAQERETRGERKRNVLTDFDLQVFPSMNLNLPITRGHPSVSVWVLQRKKGSSAQAPQTGCMELIHSQWKKNGGYANEARQPAQPWAQSKKHQLPSWVGSLQEQPSVDSVNVLVQVAEEYSSLSLKDLELDVHPTSGVRLQLQGRPNDGLLLVPMPPGTEGSSAVAKWRNKTRTLELRFPTA